MVKEQKICVVLGASRGIGLAIARELVQASNTLVYAGHRSSSDLRSLTELANQSHGRLNPTMIDIGDEKSFQSLTTSIRNEGQSVDLVVNAIGFLGQGVQVPERRLEELDPQSLIRSVQINTVPSLLLAKYIKPLMDRSKAFAFAALSAKVGSIGDNALGGWYSYRISKAALNMAIKNISIEFGRMNKNAAVIAIHPGTTDTDLSKNFLGSARAKYKIHTPEESAKNILNVLAGLDPKKDNGRFFNWDGSELPW